MGRNPLTLALGLVSLFVASGCRSGGDGPSNAELAKQAHRGIDITKMTPKELAALPAPARAAIEAQLAHGKSQPPGN